MIDSKKYPAFFSEEELASFVSSMNDIIISGQVYSDSLVKIAECVKDLSNQGFDVVKHLKSLEINKKS